VVSLFVQGYDTIALPVGRKLKVVSRESNEVRILSIRARNILFRFQATGHVMIYVGNSAGTVELPTSSQSIEDIGNAFTAAGPYCVAANGWHEWRFVKIN
jgi:hypothetical protein